MRDDVAPHPAVQVSLTPDQARLALAAFDAVQASGALGKAAEADLRALYVACALALKKAFDAGCVQGAAFDKTPAVCDLSPCCRRTVGEPGAQ